MIVTEAVPSNADETRSSELLGAHLESPWGGTADVLVSICQICGSSTSTKETWRERDAWVTRMIVEETNCCGPESLVFYRTVALDGTPYLPTAERVAEAILFLNKQWTFDYQYGPTPMPYGWDDREYPCILWEEGPEEWVYNNEDLTTVLREHRLFVEAINSVTVGIIPV